MTESRPVEFVEDRVPYDGIEEAIAETVDLYGGEMKESAPSERKFVLPLRRGMATAGGVLCTVTWTRAPEGEATVRLACDRELDAPKFQRIAMLSAGVIGALLFLIWPFFPHQKEFGTLAWLGGIVALSVYLMTLRRTSGGVAHDFLRRLVLRQREAAGSE